MNKNELAKAIAKEMKLSISQVEKIIISAFKHISKTLSKGGDFQLIGFGRFSVKKRKARNAHNPRTGKTIKVPAKKVAKFTAGKALKNSVNKN